MDLLGYIRVSSVRGRKGDSYISPSLQREAISRYATELDGTITSWHSDEDFSGGTTARPEFQKALKLINTGQADGIVVMKIDRFARSTADGLTIVRDLVDNGKVFASCQERVDPRTPTGKYMLAQFFSNAELFLDQNKAMWREAKARAIPRGAAMGPTPLGYLRVKATPKKPDQITPADAQALGHPNPPEGSFVPDPETGPLITEIFERSARGDLVGDIAVWLESIHPKPAKYPWSANCIRRILSRRVYLGEVYHGDLTATGTHPVLTDPATWTKAQPAPTRAKRRSSPRPFTQLLRCANCEGTMTGGNFSGSKGQTAIYRCPWRCGNGSVITAPKVEGYLYAIARKALADHRLSGAGEDLRALELAVTEAETELDEFVASLTARRTLGREKWEAGIELRATALAEAKAARDAAIRDNAVLQVDLENPTEHDLRHFILRAVDRVNVRRGRLPVEDRCEVVFVDDNKRPA